MKFTRSTLFLLLWFIRNANLAASFQLSTATTIPLFHEAKKTSVSSSSRLYQSSSFSNLNNDDWARISQKRREAAATSQKEITHPKPLPFFSGIKFLIASSKGTPHIYLNQLREKHGDAFIIWNQYVTITEASAIRDVLETYNLPKPDQIIEGYRFFFGDGSILMAPWEEWKKQRRMSNAALAETSTGALEPLIVKGITPLIHLLGYAADTGAVVEMDRAFQTAATDIIGLATFGKYFGLGDALVASYKDDKNKNKDDESELNVFTATDLMKTETVQQMVLPEFVMKFTRPPKKVFAAKQYLDEFLEECIEDRMKMDETKREEIVDLMNVLLESYEKGSMTREQVKGQLLTFLFAGQDTTAHTLSWMLYEISQNSTLQESLANECHEALPDRESSFANTELLQSGKFDLLDRTFYETLRMYPAVATGSTRVVGDTPIVVGDSNLELPAGTSITIPPYSLHRKSEYWPDPERFDPTRFLPDMAKDRDPTTFQAFSGGPRNCVGRRLARIEAVTTMSALLRRFRFTCAESKLPPKQFSTLTMKPKNGIRFTVERRD